MANRTVVKPDGGPPSLITILKPEAQVRVKREGITSLEPSTDVTGINSILEAHGAKLKLLFGTTEDRLQHRQRALLDSATQIALNDNQDEGIQKEFKKNHPLSDIPDLSTFYRVDAPTDQLEAIQQKLLAENLVDAAYIKPAGSEPVWAVASMVLTDPATTTPNYLGNQTYLDPAPGGIDAKLAWVLPGGSGAGVRVIDCERGWRFTHEDLVVNQGGVIAGTSMPDVWNHGTAVLGIVSGDRNVFGVTGITADAVISASSMYDQDEPVAINKAVEKMRAGDILLLERHLPGPNARNPADSQQGYIPIEWWHDTFVAIKLAVAKGIVVVEAGGNGSENLDDPVYDTPLTGFPAAWRNPFNPRNPSSGAIIVGAGAPPPGTHGNNHGIDRSRLSFSNWGSRIDTQGWGDEVTTSGYGTLQGGTDPDLHYTNDFSGTSSASPIVVGAVTCVQGILKARGRRPLTSTEARLLLRTSGSPQQADTSAPLSQRIGKRPDLRSLIPLAARFICRSGDFDGDGRYEQFITSPSGIAILKQNGSNFETSIAKSNGTRFGGWLLNTADNIFGPVADFDGDQRHEIFVVSPWGIGILKQSGSTLTPLMMKPNGTRFGGWLLNTKDNSFGPAADFDGDGVAEILVTSPWGLGILKRTGDTLNAIMMAPNGTRFDGWLLNTADNDFSQVANFNSNGKADIWVTSPWGIGVLELSGSTLKVLKMIPNGTRIGGWLLNTADNRFGPMGDFDGDRMAEMIVTSPWGIGVLKFSRNEFTCLMLKPNGTRFGGWLLNTADNQFGPARDFDGDGKWELLVTSPWGIGILKLAGDTMAAPMMQPNGTRFMPGGWLLNTANDWLGSAADYDRDGRAEILVESPWGVGILEMSGSTMAAPTMKPNGTMIGTWHLDTAENDFGHGM